jgi:hypothetical protein
MRTVRTVGHATAPDTAAVTGTTTRGAKKRTGTRTVRKAVCVLTALLLAGSLAACGGADRSSESSSAPLHAQDRGGSAGGGTGTTGSGSGGSQKGTTGGAQAPIARRAVVYSAQLSVRAKNVEQAAAQAKQMALSAGGYVGEETSTWGEDARITMRIPSDRYAAVLAQMSSRLGTKLSLRQQAQDVTGEVADVDSRVKSAQATIASFRKLLDRAGSVSEIMSVEEEISRRQADLEALQARQKALQDSTQYATVTLTLSGPPVKADPVPDDDTEQPGGFLTGLERGWNDFTAVLAVVTTVVGWLLPFLGLAAIIGVPVALILRRSRSRRSSHLPPE